MTVLHLLADTALFWVLPGWLLLHLLGWPRSTAERWLCVGPTSLATVAVAAALGGLVGVAPGVVPIGLLDLGLGLAAWYRRRRAPMATPADDGNPWPWFVVGVITPGLVLTGLAVLAMGGVVPPPSEDSVVHGQVVRWFLDGHTAPPYLPDHLSARWIPETRFGWHVAAAGATNGTGLDAARTLTLASWLVVALLPASLTFLVRRAGADWPTAGLTGLASLALGIVPFRPLALGQAPLLAGGYVVAPAAAAAAVEAVVLRSRRVATLALILAGGVVFTHPSDGPTMVLLAATLLVARRRHLPRPSWPQVAILLLWLGAFAALCAVWIGYHATPMSGPVLGHPVGDAVQSEAFLTPRHLHGFPAVVLGTAFASVHDVALPLLATVALVACWRREQVQAFAALAVVLLGLQLDSWGWQWPSPLLVRIFPWSAPERLVGLDWFALVPLAAVGAQVLVERGVRSGQGRRRVVAAALLTAIAGVPVLGRAPLILRGAMNDRLGLTPLDERALARLPGTVPPGQLILTDGTADAGAWIDALTPRQTLLDKDWVFNSAAPRVREALHHLCDPGDAERLQALGVRWVFLGSRVATAPGEADRSCPQGTRELVAVPWSTSTADVGPHLYRVAPD